MRPLLGLSALALCVLALTACGGGDGDGDTTVVETTTVTRTVTTPAQRTPTVTQPPATTPSSAPLTLHAAEQVLDRRGFATLTERDWRPGQELKVLIGVRRGETGQAGAQQAFFFVGDRFIGTDTRDPSGRIAVADQDDDEVTLTYALYRPADTIDGPSGGSADVTYEWDDGRLTPQQAIPPSNAGEQGSRR